MAVVTRFDVFLVNMDERPSRDAKNTRPAVIVSPDEVNNNLDSVIVAPVASTRAKYPTRVSVDFLGSERHVILDQIRSIDKVRLVKKIGALDAGSRKMVAARLLELFAE
jgi:mRNA interferase MazF